MNLKTLTTLTTLPAILNSLVVLFFAGLLSYSFVAERHLKGLAADVAIEKTVEHSQAVASIAGGVLNFADDVGIVSVLQRKLIDREIAELREDPKAFLKDATKQPRFQLPGIGQLKQLKQLVSIKQQLRTYYQSIVSRLLRDLRIFAGSNLVAGAFGLMLCFWPSKGDRFALTLFSLALVVAVLYGTLIFIDHYSFFNILFGLPYGWTYSVFLAIICFQLFRQAQSFGGKIGAD